MTAKLKTGDEEGRLLALQRLGIMDTAPEEPFEKIVKLVRELLGVPISAVSLIGQDRQWFKAQSGLTIRETGRDVAFCAYTIEGEEPFIVSDALNDLRFAQNPLVTGPLAIRSYVGIPLRTPDGYNVGSLCAIDMIPRQFSMTNIAAMANIADIVVSELALRQIAATDHLTGALSRRAWMERAEQEVGRARRYGRPLSLTMLDIDRFKLVNDTYGHAAGDIVIRHLSEVCQIACRQSDAFGRLGGEEFAMIMPETAAEEALAAADRIRSVFRGNPCDLGVPVPCTVSIGVAELHRIDFGLKQLLHRADQALYEAKSTGRDRTCINALYEEATLNAAGRARHP